MKTELIEVDELEELEKEENNLKKLLKENIVKQNKIIINRFKKEKNVEIGDTVEFLDGSTRKKGVIIKFFTAFSGASCIVNLLNSDGKVGKREMKLWHWNLVTLKVIK